MTKSKVVDCYFILKKIESVSVNYKKEFALPRRFTKRNVLHKKLKV